MYPFHMDDNQKETEIHSLIAAFETIQGHICGRHVPPVPSEDPSWKRTKQTRQEHGEGGT